jgi:hypothetical protein
VAIGILSWYFHFQGLEINHDIDLVVASQSRDAMFILLHVFYCIFDLLCELIGCVGLGNTKNSTK